MAIKKCSTLISLQSNPPVAAGLRKLRHVSRSSFYVYKTDKTPGGAFVLFLSYGSANLPDDCWSAQVHHEHPAGSTGTKLPLYPTPQGMVPLGLNSIPIRAHCSFIGRCPRYFIIGR
ncbi:hypothetical protein T08_11307 [Trichinella sp. T8]|nr:hypothetical protein T08_11307 [Trichinella sp. T8]